MRQLITLGTFSFLILTHVACGASPLFNHETEGHRNTSTTGATATTDAKCPIRFEAEKLCAGFNWLDTPRMSRQGVRMSLKYWTLGGEPTGPFVTPAFDIDVKPIMEQMGHGSFASEFEPVRNAQGGVEPGQYTVRVFFTMPGTWQLYFELLHGDALVNRQKVPVEI
jgi:hypothetical protein